MASTYLIKNGKAVAVVIGATDLKSCRASSQSTQDVLNAQYPAVLVNASDYKISSAAKYQRSECEVYAKPLPGGRPGDFLII